MEASQERIARLPEVKNLTGLSRTTIFDRVKHDLLTRPIRLGARAIGWPAREIAALNAAWISGASAEEVRTLVKNLEAERHPKAAKATAATA
jgi:prophage regulatory protein